MTNTEAKQSDLTSVELEALFEQSKLPEKYRTRALNLAADRDGPLMRHHVLIGLTVAQEEYEQDQRVADLIEQLESFQVAPDERTEVVEYRLSELPHGGFRWKSMREGEPDRLIKRIRVSVTRGRTSEPPWVRVEGWVIPYLSSGALSTRPARWTWLPDQMARPLLAIAATV